jgi:hypothetical protein
LVNLDPIYIIKNLYMTYEKQILLRMH